MIRKALLVFAVAVASALPGSAVTYRGLIDIAPAFEWTEVFDRIADNSIDVDLRSVACFSMAVSTTHGVQLSRNHFVGIGAEFSHILNKKWFIKSEKVSVPIYAMWRMDFFGRRCTPFFDLRGGYQLGCNWGSIFNWLYAAADVGVRISLSNRTGLTSRLAHAFAADVII